MHFVELHRDREDSPERLDDLTGYGTFCNSIDAYSWMNVACKHNDCRDIHTRVSRCVNGYGSLFENDRASNESMKYSIHHNSSIRNSHNERVSI